MSRDEYPDVLEHPATSFPPRVDEWASRTRPGVHRVIGDSKMHWQEVLMAAGAAVMTRSVDARMEKSRRVSVSDLILLPGLTDAVNFAVISSSISRS